MHKTGLKVLLGWALFLPITAYSLGLGDIDVKSFLNQPLNAEISIISARPGEIDDLLVGLANRQAFSRASLSRPSHLSDLKFKVIKSDDGSSAVISVKTQSAVKEPVLNFLVEADWTKGKVFREFTILLDPPYFAQQVSKPAPTQTAVKQKKAVVKQQQAVKQPEPIVNQVAQNKNSNNNASTNENYVNESSVTEEYSHDVSSVDSSPIPQAQPQTSYDQGVINIADGATLWSVAKTLKSDSVSMSQIMLALQRINQDAFGQNNINNLKEGSVLRVPTQQDLADLSQRDAYIEVLNQNGLWNDYLANTGKASVNASNTQSDNATSAAKTDTSEPSQGALSIVASGEGDSDKAALRSDDDVQKISNLKKQLLLSEEEVESLKVEKDDLASRLKMLEAELEKRSQLDNLLTIQDDNLATMEQALSEDELKPKVVNDEITGDNSNEVVADSTDIITEEQEPVVEIAAEEMTVPMESETTLDDVANEVTVINEEPTVIVQEPAPIIVSEAGDSSSMVDDIVQALISNPIVQGAIAFVLLLIFIVIKFLKGRKSKETEKSSDSIEDSLSEDPIDTQSGIIIPNVNDEDETPINVPQMEKEQPIDDFASTLSGVKGDAEDEEEDEFSKTAVISAEDMAAIEEVDEAEEEPEEAESESDEQDETLDEVDVYLAYSLFDNAEELLKEKLEETPDRADYRAKLLDTYFATKNTEAFIDEASSLKNLGDKSTKYWGRVQAMGFELDANNPMFAEGEGGDVGELAIAKPEMADFDIGADDESSAATSDFDLSLDGDDTNFDLSEDKNDDGALEFNLDEDLASDLKPVEDELPDDLDSLDFDLDESFVEPDSTKEPEENTFNEEDGLEFNLDDDSNVDFNETVVIDDTAVIETDETVVIETDDLEFTIDEIEDDSLDISLDDIEPEINIEDDLIEEDLTGTIDVISDEFVEEGELLIDETADTVDEMEETVSFSVAEEETDIDIDLDLNDSNEGEMEETVSFSAAEETDNEIDLNVSNEDLDLNLSNEGEMEETVSFSTAEDSGNDLDLDLDASNEDDSVDFNITDDNDSNIEIKDDAFDETVNMSNLDEDISIEKTEIVSAIDVEDELVISESDIEDELVMPEIEDEFVIDDDDNELVIPDFDIQDELVVPDIDDDLDLDDITDIGNIEGLMLPDDVDEVATKLDLAKAFNDMGDAEGARSSLEEVLADGNDEQKAEAKALLDGLSK